MIETQYITLDMKPSGVLPVLYCSQYDIGRPLGMVVYNGGEAVNLGDYTVTIEATRTDGVAITAAVTTDGNIGAFETTATMTNKADRYGAQLVLNASGQRVASLPFTMCVVRAEMDENAESIEEDASLYQQYTETVQTLIADIRAAVTAETTRAEAAEASLQSAISAEASARQTLANDLSAETAARQSADTSIGNDISTIRTALASETSSRSAADTNLQNQINQIVAPTGEAPSAAEVQNARITFDGLTYSSLGGATRGQALGLSNRIKSIVNGGTQSFTTGDIPGYFEPAYHTDPSAGYRCSRINLDGNAKTLTFNALQSAPVSYAQVHKNNAFTASGGNSGQHTMDLTGADYVLLNFYGSSYIQSYTIEYNSVATVGALEKIALGYSTHSAPWAEYYGKTITFPFSMCDLLPGYVVIENPNGMQPQTGYKHLLFDARAVKSISLSGGTAVPGLAYGFLYRSMTDTNGITILGKEATPSYTFTAPTDGLIGINAYGGTYCDTMTITFWDRERAIGYNPRSYRHSVRKPISFNNKKCSFIGDSITAGFTSGTSQTTETYPKLFCEAVGAICDNEAVAGATIKSVSGYPYLLNQLPHVSDPDILFVSGGVNDWQLGVNVNDFKTAVYELILQIDTDFPDIPVIWITPINTANPVIVGHPVANLEVYRDLMTQTIVEHDVQHRFSIVQGSLFNFPNENDRSDYIQFAFGDGLHPSESGYENIYTPGLLTALL